MANPIAAGRTADVYSDRPGTVVKLFHSWVPESDVESERRKATIAHSMGIRTPAVGEIVRRDGRIGLVFERAPGVTMLEKMRSEPDAIRTLAPQFAELHLVQLFISSYQYYRTANRSLRSRTVNLQSNGLAVRL